MKGVKFPAKLEQAVMRALDRDPRNRQPDVRAFADEVRQALDDGAVETGDEKRGVLGTLKSMLRERRK